MNTGDVLRSTGNLLFFASGRTMDDYFNRILNLTSYIKQCLIRFIEDLLFCDVEKLSRASNVSGCHGRSSSTRSESPHGSCCTCSHSHSVITQIMDCDRRLTNVHEDLSVNGKCRTSVVRRTQAFVSQGFSRRVRRTLQGSTEDIGWLQRTEGLPPVQDGTNRFMELLGDIRNGKHCLPDTLVYLLIPGLFSNHSPLYFVNTKRFFSKMGLTSHIAKIHSEASVEKNAWELKQYIEELYWGSGKRVLLLGHSKGGVDAAAALSMYWPELKDKVAGLALVQSPYGGSPIASDILRKGQIADKEARRIMEFVICKLIKGDMRALEDLTYEKRQDFISKHLLPSDQVPLISFHTEASAAPAVLATMSLIAHAELPGFPFPNFFLNDGDIEQSYGGQKFPVVMPLAAAMAVSALHLRLRYGEPSDGLVTRRDAEVPGSVVVRPTRKLHHAWMVCSTMKKDEVEADASEMCEALLTMLVEIGRTKEVSLNKSAYRSVGSSLV